MPAARRHAPATSSLPGCPLFPLDVSRDATLPPSPWGSLPLLLVLSRARSAPWPKPPQAHCRRSHSHPIPLDRSLCLRDPPHPPLRPRRAMLRREPCIILTTVVFNLGHPRLPASIRSVQAIPEHEELLYGFPVSPSSFAPLPAVLFSPLVMVSTSAGARCRRREARRQ